MNFSLNIVKNRNQVLINWASLTGLYYSNALVVGGFRAGALIEAYFSPWLLGCLG
jgi:hypothetical protein